MQTNQLIASLQKKFSIFKKSTFAETKSNTMNRTTTDTQVLGFVKENKIWYADLPEFLEQGLGTKANLMMVDGADTFLDLLSGNTDEVTLKISSQPFKGYQAGMKKFKKGMNRQLLDLIGHAPVEYGAYYNVSELDGKPYQHQLWLCPVTEYVFGSYPEEIYTAVV
jgi:hypothetical protein